jgi:hypothetical protein
VTGLADVDLPQVLDHPAANTLNHPLLAVRVLIAGAAQDADDQVLAGWVSAADDASGGWLVGVKAMSQVMHNVGVFFPSAALGSISSRACGRWG